MAQGWSQASGRILVAPLARAQVEAAVALHQSLEGWKRIDTMLREIREHFPLNDDLMHVLPKTITLNSLYPTGVLAVKPIASHFVDAIAVGASLPPVECVEEMAWVPELRRRFRSFASRYCHCFVDTERFPVLDTFAWEALVLHVGRARVADYQAYYEGASRLRVQVGGCSFADLDQYLWLRGQWIAHQRDRRALINDEVRMLFEKRPGETGELIERAFAEG